MLIKERGVTLMELIVTISIAGILTAVALPSFQQVIQSNRLATQSNQFITMISVARSEAVKRGRRASICAGQGGSCACTEKEGCDDNWKKGILVFIDTDGDCKVDVDENNNPLILREGAGLNDDAIKITGVGCLGFSSLGTKGGETVAVAITLCSSRLSGENVRNITIEPTGSAVVKRSTKTGCL